MSQVAASATARSRRAIETSTSSKSRVRPNSRLASTRVRRPASAAGDDSRREWPPRRAEAVRLGGSWRSARQRSISARAKRRWPPGVRRQATLPASPQRRSVLGLTPSSAAASARRIQSRRVISFGAGSRISRPIGENGGELNHLYHRRLLCIEASLPGVTSTTGCIARRGYLAIGVASPPGWASPSAPPRHTSHVVAGQRVRADRVTEDNEGGLLTQPALGRFDSCRTRSNWTTTVRRAA